MAEPGEDWVNFATDILEIPAGYMPDGRAEMQLALAPLQREPARIGREQIDRLFSRPVPPAVIYFPTGLYQFTVSVTFPSSVTVLMGSKAVLLPNDGVRALPSWL